MVTLEGSGIVTVVQGGVYTEDGASWTDLHDGTGTILTASSGSVDVNTVGTYTLEYTHADAASNSGNTVSRTVNVVSAPDTTAPVLTLSGASSVNVEFGSDFVDAGASWTDNVDGTGIITGFNSGSINTGSLGNYIVSYEHTDSSSNVGTGVTRTVHVIDTTAPVVTLSGTTVNIDSEAYLITGQVT